MASPESTPNRGPAPFALCTSCQVGFEVPDEIWEKGYREVRCGSCNVKFDLHQGIEAARLLLAGEGAGGNTSGRTSGDTSASRTRALDESATDDHERLQDRDGFERYLYDDLEMDQTVTDFDLFSEEAGLPEVAYFERFDMGSLAEADKAAAALLQDPEVSPAEARVAIAGSAQHASASATTPSAAGDELAAASTSQSTAPVEDDEQPEENGPRKVIDDVAPEQPLVFDYDRQGGASSGHAGAKADPEASPATAERAASGQAAAAPSGSAQSGQTPPDRAPKATRKLVPALFTGVLVVLISVAAFAGWMVAVHQSPGFYNNSFWRPAVLASCRVFGCSVPARLDLDKLVLLQRNVFSHPGVSDALVVNVSFRNEATFAQGYPVLEVRFSDSLGRSVAERDFAPKDYLDDWQSGDLMGAGRRLDINLEIDDPGEDADSFEFNFRVN